MKFLYLKYTILKQAGEHGLLHTRHLLIQPLHQMQNLERVSRLEHWRFLILNKILISMLIE